MELHGTHREQEPLDVVGEALDEATEIFNEALNTMGPPQDRELQVGEIASVENPTNEREAS